MDGAARVIEAGAEYGRALALLIEKYEQYRDRPPEGAVMAVDIERWTWWAADA
jgi:hypothetical protein